MNKFAIKIGDTLLKNPLICGSGEHFIELSGMERALKAGAAAVVIKSTNESDAAKEQLEKTDYALIDSDFNKINWDHNPPRGASLFNRSGLHPLPFDEWLDLAIKADELAKTYDAYAVASLIPADIDNLIHMAKEVEKAGIRILEVNVGAPHGKEAAKGAILLEQEADHIREITEKLRAAVDMPLWIKLAGQSPEVPAMAEAAMKAGADTVTLMGRYMGFIPDIETGEPILGTHAAIGGSWALPLTAHHLVKTRERIGKNYPVMATNGARNGNDIIRFMISGASAVQMTSAIFTGGFEVIEKSLKQIEDYLNEKNMTANDLVGLAADKVKTYAEQQNNKEYWREFTPE
ncbi:tRNA-dihydrouridine synthase [Pseudemcibacter aquimaris]|uniref:tRNA-dihydrouridine synthase n=1 Tax=Pseudemcibacter aquimaris TaxID=2857064 RepID=UPI00201162F0|nr:tRNA-dihydrouridine synthase [Pseudemcibacter aquimaris]MCC3860182.1 tRNA-dihydrouridine synthase [Pseudemcibacter aquimaris]WDU57508.1 tRNA-dihydrouridine synthase [Pseudemcibacter aquimaris]